MSLNSTKIILVINSGDAPNGLGVLCYTLSADLVLNNCTMDVDFKTILAIQDLVSGFLAFQQTGGLVNLTNNKLIPWGIRPQYLCATNTSSCGGLNSIGRKRIEIESFTKQET